MKTTDNLDFYREACQKFQESGYGNLKSPHLSNLICEASRHSPLGIGGDAFRSWVAGVYKDGVFLWVHNHKVGISFVTDSTATLTRGCQSGRAHGNPWPTPSIGKMEPFRQAPEKVKTIILAIAKDLGRHVVGVVLDGCEAVEKERAKRKKEAEAEDQAIIDNWEEK